MLKITRVTPMFKKGDRLDVNNYRPTSLVSSISKIIEKLFYPSQNIFFKLFLVNRAHYTNINESNSNPAKVMHGVPQGSVLGMLIFIHYFHEWFKCIF